MSELEKALAAADEPSDRLKGLRAVAELLQRQGIDPAEVGRIQRVSVYQQAQKDEEGQPRILDLVGVQLSPAWAEGPAWPVVQPAKPVRPRRRTAPALLSDWRTTIVLPDEQIGYWQAESGTLVPMHDEQAMAVALEIVRQVRPERVVHNGDTVDFAPQGRFRKEPRFVTTTQAGLDRAHEWFAQLAEQCDRQDMLEGNHDRRLANLIVDNAAAAFGLRRANVPTEWPVLSIPNLLRLDELGVTYHGGYPAGRMWLNDQLAVEHGVNINPDKTLNEEQVSVIHGHVHRYSVRQRRRRTRTGSQVITVASPGCLCRIDGFVPSQKTGTDDTGLPVPTAMDWQQGVIIAHHTDDGRHALEPVEIHDGTAVLRGQPLSVEG